AENSSDTDLRSEVNTFMLAGLDTMAGGISWLLYHLPLSPEHQERCREGIRGILGDGSSITWDQLGITVVHSIWGLHHSYAIWENLYKFFHGTPSFHLTVRNCIWQHFAMAELKVAIALILLRFKVIPDPTRPLVFLPQVILKPKSGVHLHLKKLP
ncbi:hypothetical protein HPG69_012292, partial [Diceros bicornis minor]